MGNKESQESQQAAHDEVIAKFSVPTSPIVRRNSFSLGAQGRRNSSNNLFGLDIAKPPDAKSPERGDANGMLDGRERLQRALDRSQTMPQAGAGAAAAPAGGTPSKDITKRFEITSPAPAMGSNSAEAKKAYSYDFLIKLLLIGNPTTGKSDVLFSFSDSFMSTQFATLGIDFRIKMAQVDGKVVKLQIWSDRRNQLQHST